VVVSLDRERDMNGSHVSLGTSFTPCRKGTRQIGTNSEGKKRSRRTHRGGVAKFIPSFVPGKSGGADLFGRSRDPPNSHRRFGQRGNETIGSRKGGEKAALTISRSCRGRMPPANA